jgi:N-acetylglucosamine kinase-like BadF-type ATPase
MRSEKEDKPKTERWLVIRIVEQRFESLGNTKEEALENCAEYGDPHSVRIVKETISKIKEL